MVAKKAVSQAKKPTQSKAQKVDFYPNRMTFAVSALAGTTLIFIGLIAVSG